MGLPASGRALRLPRVHHAEREALDGGHDAGAERAEERRADEDALRGGRLVRAREGDEGVREDVDCEGGLGEDEVEGHFEGELRCGWFGLLAGWCLGLRLRLRLGRSGCGDAC